MHAAARWVLGMSAAVLVAALNPAGHWSAQAAARTRAVWVDGAEAAQGGFGLAVEWLTEPNHTRGVEGTHVKRSPSPGETAELVFVRVGNKLYAGGEAWRGLWYGGQAGVVSLPKTGAWGVVLGVRGGYQWLLPAGAVVTAGLGLAEV